MKILRTHKIKINPSKVQRGVLHALSFESIKLYNFLLNKTIDYYSIHKKYIGQYNLQIELKSYKTNYLTYDQKKEILRGLNTNFISFFNLLKKRKDLNPQIPKFLSTYYFKTISVTQDFIINNDILTLVLLGRNKIDLKLYYTNPINGLSCLRRKTPGSQIKQLKISYKDGSYYASIVYWVEIEPKRIDKSKLLSIDLGKNPNYIALYDNKTNAGVLYKSKLMTKNQKFYDKRIEDLKSKRDTHKKNSRKWNKYHKKVKKLQSKKNHQTKLILHKTSKELASKNRSIIVGDLKNLKSNNYTKTKGNKNLNKAMNLNWPIQTFMRILTYKTELMGNQVIKVNEAYTSKTCSLCGSINNNLTLKDREYECTCGLKIDRDINGAINILNVYLKEQKMGFYNDPLETKVSEMSNWCSIYHLSRRT